MATLGQALTSARSSLMQLTTGVYTGEVRKAGTPSRFSLRLVNYWLSGQTCNHLSRWQLYFYKCIQKPVHVRSAVPKCSSPFTPSASAADQAANKSLIVLSAQCI